MPIESTATHLENTKQMRLDSDSSSIDLTNTPIETFSPNIDDGDSTRETVQIASNSPTDVTAPEPDGVHIANASKIEEPELQNSSITSSIDSSFEIPDSLSNTATDDTLLEAVQRAIAKTKRKAIVEQNKIQNAVDLEKLKIQNAADYEKQKIQNAAYHEKDVIDYKANNKTDRIWNQYKIMCRTRGIALEDLPR